jgi:hypothetical protein
MSKAIDIKLSANELSMGITKLSGSKPFRKVSIETPYDTRIIADTARMFAIKRTKRRPVKVDSERVPFIAGERSARIKNMTIEAAQALRIVFA